MPAEITLQKIGEIRRLLDEIEASYAGEESGEENEGESLPPTPGPPAAMPPMDGELDNYPIPPRRMM